MTTDKTEAHDSTPATDAAARRDGSRLSEWLGPVAEARCWQEPQYEKPPRQMFELVQFDGFRALPPGAHSLYTRAQLDAAVAAERERWAPLLRASGRVLQAADDGYLQPAPETLQGGIAVDELREAWGAFAPARIRGA